MLAEWVGVGSVGRDWVAAELGEELVVVGGGATDDEVGHIICSLEVIFSNFC